MPMLEEIKVETAFFHSLANLKGRTMDFFLSCLKDIITILISLLNISEVTNEKQ